MSGRCKRCGFPCGTGGHAKCEAAAAAAAFVCGAPGWDRTVRRPDETQDEKIARMRMEIEQ